MFFTDWEIPLRHLLKSLDASDSAAIIGVTVRREIPRTSADETPDLERVRLHPVTSVDQVSASSRHLAFRGPPANVIRATPGPCWLE
jgi:hypothetical protein